ncbi:MAG: alpha/beta hydrolase [Gemmatimonadota bacterium]
MIPRAVVILALASLLCPARSAPAQPTGQLVTDTVPAASLAGNLLGDPTRQPAFVYLPPSYDSAHRRYPVIYLLHGILDSPSVWVEPTYQGMTIQATMDSLIAAGEIEETIVVMPNGRNAYGASGWMNSAVAGRWGDYLAFDVVRHVDATYRTIPRRESRALLGHSMGGFGAIRLAMLHPDVFSVAWGMNPCCLCCMEIDAEVDPELWQRIKAYPSIEAMWEDLEERGDPWPLILVGMWTLFFPDPDDPPFYYDAPVREEDGRLVSTGAIERVAAPLPLARAAEHAEALRSLRGLAFDSAFGDEFAHIPIGTEAFSDTLEALQVPHVYEVYEGDHRNRMRERMATRILPWIDLRLRRPDAGSRSDR